MDLSASLGARRPGRCLAAHTFALSPIVARYTEGFSNFVTSMTAPVASGWSDLAGWDSHPLRSAPCHGAHPLRSFVASVSSQVSAHPFSDRRAQRALQRSATTCFKSSLTSFAMGARFGLLTAAIDATGSTAETSTSPPAIS